MGTFYCLKALECETAKGRVSNIASPRVRESRFRNAKNFYLWNPESWALESGMELKESRIPLTIVIRNPSSTDMSVIQYLESGIHGLESRIQDCLGLFTWGKQPVLSVTQRFYLRLVA